MENWQISTEFTLLIRELQFQKQSCWKLLWTQKQQSQSTEDYILPQISKLQVGLK